MTETATREKFNTNPSKFTEQYIKKYIVNSPKNRLEHFQGKPIYDEPLVGFADGDDPIFNDYKKIIGEFHMTPREALSAHLKSKGLKDIPEPEHISVIVWILPIALHTKISLRKETEVTSIAWNHTRIYGEELNKELQLNVVSLFEELGHRAVAPMYSEPFKRLELPNGAASNWSLRHAAYAAGLGTFSLSDGFITPKGIAMRVGSVVVDMALPATPRTYRNHIANCLFYIDKSCTRCIERCPAGAISEAGHDKKKCRKYLSEEIKPKIIGMGREDGYIFSPVVGCGLCQTKVPCESRIPPSSAS